MASRKSIRLTITADSDNGFDKWRSTAQRWCREVWQNLCTPLRLALQTHPLPGDDISELVAAGRIREAYPPLGSPFVTIAVEDDERHFAARTLTERNLAAIADDLRWASGVAITGGILEPSFLGRDPGWPRLYLTASRDYGADQFTLGLLASSDFLVPDADGEARLLSVARLFADGCNPTYGEAGPNHSAGPTGSTLEAKIGVNAEHSPTTGRTLLRGYSWLTLLPQEIGDRLGGVQALRDTGAFHDVSPLAAGGYWLQATEHLRHYDNDSARRVRDALSNAMPALYRHALVGRTLEI
ncbi:hypothetical protein Val02_49350 [Virgisporangium aliadipatigenens]|uniref:Uncharacterized protein n=1 Tax=Virgisporangium aliadipatigenens TaxID=741659 RepID=A0A8J3YM66_9ACTN|nr:hypothetical protein [Virgisporangium aliadipatigenens]GIJ48049.1 hypothetical protein Val02_49350 [Virgisporangium aliadipatigenens]